VSDVEVNSVKPWPRETPVPLRDTSLDALALLWWWVDPRRAGREPVRRGEASASTAGGNRSVPLGGFPSRMSGSGIARTRILRSRLPHRADYRSECPPIGHNAPLPIANNRNGNISLAFLKVLRPLPRGQPTLPHRRHEQQTKADRIKLFQAPATR